MRKAIIVCLGLVLIAGLSLAATTTAEVKSQLSPKELLEQSIKPQGSNLPGLYQEGKALLSEGFEGSFPPAGWQTVNVLGSYAWVQSNAYAYTGTYSAYIHYESTGGDDWLITPPMYPESGTDTLKFWIRKYFTSAYPPDFMYIKVSTTDSATGSFGSALLTIDVANMPASTWVEYAVPLTSYNGQRIFLAFHHQDTDGNGCFIDDVTGPELNPSWAHDLRLQSIDQPSAIATPLVPFTPTVTVDNNGTNPETDFWAFYSIDDGSKAEVYKDSVFVTTPDTLQADSSVQFTFTDFTPLEYTQYAVTAWVALPGDENAANDIKVMNFRTWDLDVGTAAIVAPSNYVDPSTTVDPQATFHNYGQQAADFDAYFEIYDGGASLIYGESVYISGLASGADTTVTFPTFNVPAERQNFTTSAYTVMAYDLDNGNDSMAGSFSSLPLWYYVAAIPNGGGAYTRWSYNGSCVSNGMLWMVGGRRDASWTVLDNVGTYDPASNTWDDTKPVLPQPRVYLTAAANDEYVFALGGRDGAGATIYANVERLESPGGAAWVTMTPMPAGRVFGAAVVEDGYLYYIGGTSDAGGATATTTFWRYDIAADTAGGTPWDQTLAQLPAALDNHDATVYNGKIYVLGNGTNNNTYIYDIAGDSWTTVANTGKPVQEMYEAVTAYNQIWAIGGNDGAASVTSVNIFDPVTETWSVGTPMQEQRMSFGAGTVGDVVVSAGGVAWPGFIPSMTTEAIDISYMGVSGGPATKPALGEFALMPNYPNPVNGRTTFSFNLPKAGRYLVTVYNIAGQAVDRIEGQGQAGLNTVSWNASKTVNGVYLYRLSADGRSAAGKMVVIK